MRLSVLYKILIFLSLFFFFGYFIFADHNQNVEISYPDQCMSCHKNYQSIGHSHSVTIFGCSKCHGGNRWATNKKDAHKGMYLKPSRLENVNRSCDECHKDISHRIKMSLMENQNGIKNVLMEQWVEKSTNLDNKKLARKLAQDHFEKGCASCHINQREEVFKQGITKKGGGCVDCHRVKESNGKIHSKLSMNIPSTNCLKCHTRSNRIGLSYYGKFESEGYGTPYKNGNFSNKLDSNRYYYKLPSDVHHNYNMDCIDCHTEVGVMGDGKEHKHMESAVDISCNDCHKPNFKEVIPKSLAEKLINTNSKISSCEKVAYTSKKNTPIYNLQKNKNNKMEFYLKNSGKKIDMVCASDKPYHSLKIHKRLDCSACHTKWMPSCYGCHEVYFDKGKQYNWVKHKNTKGVWMEFRSFLRFESPSLGINNKGKIMPYAPGCQVVGTLYKNKKVKQFHAMAMAGWNPHTTSKKARTCVECHFDSASLGLGKGMLNFKNKKINFTPYFDSKKSGFNFSYPIDAFVSKEGKQFQTVSREKARSFSKKELNKIVSAYRCIVCHREYSDKIYVDFEKSKRMFNKGVTPCLK